MKEPIGKQDQYIAAFGGVTVFEFSKDDTVVRASRERVSEDTLDLLEDNLVMVSTGFYRAASQVLKEQDDKSAQQRRRTMIAQPPLREGARASAAWRRSRPAT